MNDVLISLRLLLRDWRSGELSVLIASLLIAVSAMTTVSFFSDRVRGALESQAERMLGADLVVVSDHPVAPAFEAEAKRRGLRSTLAEKFPSMVSSKEGSVLSEIKAVEEAYPLRGRLRLSNGAKGIPKPGDIWVDRKLVVKLHLAQGERVEIGDAYFKISAIVEEEPEAAFSFMSLGPGLIMNRADIPRTKLITTGSRVHYMLYAAGDGKSVDAYRRWVKARLGRGQNIEDAREGSPQVKAMLDRSGVFLGMSALLAVVLASVAVSLSARRFMERHLDGCAVMRVMGMTGPRLFRIFLYQFSMLGLASGLLGSGIGFFAQNMLGLLLAGTIGVKLPSPSMLPALEGCAASLILLLGFVLPRISALSKVPALHVIRREEGKPSAGHALGLAALGLLFFWQANDFKLGMVVFGGFLATVLVSSLMLWFFLKHLKIGGWRLANLRRRAASSVVQVLAFGLALMAILVLTLVRRDLVTLWHESLPLDAPNRFVLNIQPDQLKDIADYFGENGLPAPEFFPMVKGRLVQINGRAVSSDDYEALRAKRLVDREFNLSWTENMRAGNEIVSGKWWGRKDHGKAILSVEDGIAKTLSIHMDDMLTFDVAGSRISAKVVNLRKVDWNSFRVNFFVLTPPGLLEDFPTSYITSFYLPSEKAEALNGLSRRFPSLLVLDVSSVIAKMQKMMEQAARAIEFVFLFSIASSAMVLTAAFSATLDERVRETAILRTLGADKGQILTAYAAEFLVLGGLSGLFASLGATLVGWLAASRLLDLPARFDPEVIMAGFFIGMAAILLMGLFWTRKALSYPPSALLRSLG